MLEFLKDEIIFQRVKIIAAVISIGMMISTVIWAYTSWYPFEQMRMQECANACNTHFAECIEKKNLSRFFIPEKENISIGEWR